MLTRPNSAHELRIPNTGNGTVSGYFDALAAEAARWSGRTAGVRPTLNPVNRDLLARAANRAKRWARHTTADLGPASPLLQRCLTQAPDTPEGLEARYLYSYGRQNWFEYSAQEHLAVREAVGLFDQTSFAKFLLQGRDAEAALQRICANDVGVPPSRVVYTSMLNERGGIVADLTVTRISEESYLIIIGCTTATRDFTRISTEIPEDAHAFLTDVTSAYAVLSVMGPRSRSLLSQLTDDDLSNETFPFLTSREISLGYARARATRITYVGELGWELYIPTEFALGVYDAIVREGESLGLRHAGFHAMDSLRIEKDLPQLGP